MTVEMISLSISIKTMWTSWDKLAAPGSSVRHATDSAMEDSRWGWGDPEKDKRISE